jgi:hypothetical protein
VYVCGKKRIVEGQEKRGEGRGGLARVFSKRSGAVGAKPRASSTIEDPAIDAIVHLADGNHLFREGEAKQRGWAAVSMKARPWIMRSNRAMTRCREARRM